MQVELISVTDSPLDVAAASAATCYSSKGIVMPDGIKNSPRKDSILLSTLEAGHLTTRQHVHFTFAISGISRFATWEFLHSHPHYNSEQVSQRYTLASLEQSMIPAGIKKDSSASARFTSILEKQFGDYKRLLEMLLPVAEEEFFNTFPHRRVKGEKWQKAIERKAAEAARYLLPQATTAYLYHTVNLLTLMRYFRMYESFSSRDELRELMRLIRCELEIHCPDVLREIPDPLPMEETLDYHYLRTIDSGNVQPTSSDSLRFPFYSDVSISSPAVMLSSGFRRKLYELVGVMASRNSTGIGFVELLKENPHIDSTLNEGIHSRSLAALSMVDLLFAKELSISADSQNQRHRMTPGFRVLSPFREVPLDFITPALVRKSGEAMNFYSRSMKHLYRSIISLSPGRYELMKYLLPNAHRVYLIERGDLLSYLHKWKTRLCFNAQDEIFDLTIAEIEEFLADAEEMREFMLAPCGLRKRLGHKPYCPEGDRFCGKPVWNLPFEQYREARRGR